MNKSHSVESFQGFKSPPTGTIKNGKHTKPIATSTTDLNPNSPDIEDSEDDDTSMIAPTDDVQQTQNTQPLNQQAQGLPENNQQQTQHQPIINQQQTQHQPIIYQQQTQNTPIIYQQQTQHQPIMNQQQIQQQPIIYHQQTSNPPPNNQQQLQITLPTQYQMNSGLPPQMVLPPSLSDNSPTGCVIYRDAVNQQTKLIERENNAAAALYRPRQYIGPLSLGLTDKTIILVIASYNLSSPSITLSDSQILNYVDAECKKIKKKQNITVVEISRGLTQFQAHDTPTIIRNSLFAGLETEIGTFELPTTLTKPMRPEHLEKCLQAFCAQFPSPKQERLTNFLQFNVDEKTITNLQSLINFIYDTLLQESIYEIPTPLNSNNLTVPNINATITSTNSTAAQPLAILYYGKIIPLEQVSSGTIYKLLMHPDIQKQCAKIKHICHYCIFNGHHQNVKHSPTNCPNKTSGMSPPIPSPPTNNNNNNKHHQSMGYGDATNKLKQYSQIR